MKKTIALLLIVTILAAVLTGCQKEKNEFFEDLKEFHDLVNEADLDLYDLLIYESSYMLAWDVKGEGHVAEITAYAEENAKNVDQMLLAAQVSRISDLYTKISENKYGKNNHKDMLEAVKLAAGGIIQMTGCVTRPKGTADEFEESYKAYHEIVKWALDQIGAFLEKE